MPRIDLWWPSATRVEVDQRSREARLRLEHLERLLTLRMLPAQIWLRRVLCLLGLQIFGFGERLEIRSPDTTLTGPPPRQQPEMPAGIPAEISVAARRLYAAALASVDGMRRNSAPHSPASAAHRRWQPLSPMGPYDGGCTAHET